ncbi:MAG: PspC domain-containing protein [Candidatus Latescibacterota bacterium]
MSDENRAKRRLCKSRKDKIVDGVCGGIARYLNLDPTIVRLAFVVITLLGGGVLILLYVAGMIIMPRALSESEESPDHSARRGYLLGIGLVVIGALVLLGNFDVVPGHLWRFWHIPWGILWGLFLILAGAMLVSSRKGSDKAEISEVEGGNPEGGEREERKDPKRLFRTRKDRRIAGVCGGIADYFSMDATIVRLAWVLGTIASVGTGVLVYLVMAILVPERSVGAKEGEAAPDKEEN